MDKKEIKISLIYQEEILYCVNSNDIVNDISIGRSKECIWQIPALDKSASAHHALIKKTAKGIVLVDTNSKNGIFVNGQKVLEVKLYAGVRTVLGETVLQVEYPQNEIHSSVIANQHKLEILVGERKGEVISLNNSEFSIGSSPENDLVITEHLVSKVHTLLREDESGACWVKDNNSSNGTRINNVLLAHGKERMLKDGDIISIAFFDVRFLDKNIKHNRSYIGLKILAGIITVTLLVAGYFAYLAATPNSYEMIQKARSLASKADFIEAKHILNQASSAREYSKFKAERDMLLDKISVWELTLKEWKTVCKMLEKKRWIDAVRSLSSIQCDRMENWNWNESEAVYYKNLAQRVKENIDLYLRISGKLENEETTVDELQKLNEELSNALAVEKKLKSEKILISLITEIISLQKKLQKNLENHRQLNKVLAKLNLRVPNFTRIVKDLEEIQANSQGIVKRSAIRYLEPIRKLHHSQNQMLYNAAVLTCLDFKKINFDLALPTVDECAVNSHINSQRQTILRIHENFIAAYKQVLHMHNLLRQWNISFTETHPLLLMFADTTNIQKVIECDALLAKLPARSRKTPQSVYDKMLGIEYFYEFLRALPAKNDDSVLERVKIRPECISLRELCKQYSGFVTFTELPENKWLLRNNISKLHDYCVSQLEVRDSLIKEWQDECSKTPLVRKAIILRGMIIYFASPQSISKSYISQFANDFKKFRNLLVVLNNSYDNAPPEEAIKIRDRILKNGLPGDPIVRRMWAFKQ